MIVDFNLILFFCFLLCHLQNGLSIYCDLHLLLLSEVSFIFKKFQSEVKRNGRVVQGYPPITEAQEEHEEDAELEEQEAVTVSLLSQQKRAVNLRGAGEKSPMCGPSQKSVAQNSSRSRRKIQEITLNTLDPSNLSPR